MDATARPSSETKPAKSLPGAEIPPFPNSASSETSQPTKATGEGVIDIRYHWFSSRVWSASSLFQDASPSDQSAGGSSSPNP